MTDTTSMLQQSPIEGKARFGEIHRNLRFFKQPLFVKFDIITIAKAKII